MLALAFLPDFFFSLGLGLDFDLGLDLAFDFDLEFGLVFDLSFGFVFGFGSGFGSRDLAKAEIAVAERELVPVRLQTVAQRVERHIKRQRRLVRWLS